MRTLAAVLLAFLLVPHALAAKPPRESLVVDTAWLAKHLNDKNLVLLHVGDKDEYAARHIPGARLVSLADISTSDHGAAGLMLEMPAADDLRTRLEKLGISNDSQIVVYYGKDWVSPSTRVIFTLDSAGLGDRTLLLDGGMGAWTRDGHATTDVLPPAKTGKLAPLKTQKRIVDADYVLANRAKKGIALLDGRAAVFYDGTDTGGMHEEKHKTGHIAGAGSFPYTEVTNDQLMLRSPDELRALFTKAGVEPGDTIVAYCHIGQQATAVLFAARTLGHAVQLYDGSMQDWSRHKDAQYDVETGR